VENETIIFKNGIDKNLLKSAFAKILGIDEKEIQLVKAINEEREIDFKKILIVQYYLFEHGDFKFEITPLISQTTRANNYTQNYKLYENLMKEIRCDLLIPGNYNDLSESYSIILGINGSRKEVYTEQPEEYGEKGINILKEK
jgi:hypothetical protein